MLVSGEASSSGLHLAADVFSLRPYMAFPPRREGEGALVSLPLGIRTPVLSGEGPTLMSSLNFSGLFKGSISKYSHIGGLDL